MVKNKVFFVIFASLILNFVPLNLSFALDNTETQNVYPDFAYEFTGKDTCEKFNRKLFVFNLKLNKYVIRPLNIVWASVVPKYGMDRFQNAYLNMNYPVRVMGCLFQKDFKASKQETVRFLTNTTLGLGGLYDVASTRFKIEPRQEDIEQVLAHYKIKQGPYLVLPIVRGNVRDLCGKLLACPLRPTSYVGPFGAAANALFAVNNSTYSQPMVKKIDDSYADPYELARQIDGISMYLKISNLDRPEVFREKTSSQSFINVNKISEVESVNPDVKLTNFNSQGSLVDSMRTALFDNQKIDGSIWSDMSLWNRTFGKKIKISSVNINQGKPNYKYRYILQKDKNSPLAILYPSIGEGITADKSVVLAKLLYDEGYSVLIQGSAFQWEFIKSMPNGFKPGLPAEDARYLRLVSAKIINNLEEKTNYKFGRKILVGCSYGALTGMFTAAQEEGENTLNISKFIAINPPIDLFFAMEELDKYSRQWKDDTSDIKMRTAIAAEKIMLVANQISKKNLAEMPEDMPFNEDEAKLVIGFIMKQKLYDVVFAVENYSRGKKNTLDESINKMKFQDYAEKYLFVNLDKTPEQISYETSLYSISNFLDKSDKYKIYHTVDDYFVNQAQLNWLKKHSKEKTLLFSNGSHLGCMYRKEFIDDFKNEIKKQDKEKIDGEKFVNNEKPLLREKND